MTDVNVVKQFYTEKLEPGNIGAIPGQYRDSNGINRSVSMAKSLMVGLERDYTVSNPISIGIDWEYTGLASTLTVFFRCYIGY
jgi:hypothetical protein